MKFEIAVEGTAEIAPHLRRRLDALSRADRSSIKASELRRVTGSVDIDVALRLMYPNANRWDYAIGYRISNQDDMAYFVEVHKATVAEVPRVVKKKQWLEGWMQDKPLGDLSHRRFVWVSAGPIKIPPTSPQRRELNKHGLQLVPWLKLR